jgi:hypothetical protein
MGLLNKQVSPIGEFKVEFLSVSSGSNDPPVFGPGGIIQGPATRKQVNVGRVVIGVKRPTDVTRVGISFIGTTKVSGNASTTELFAIEDVLWDSKPSKGKEVAKAGSLEVNESSAKVLSTTAGSAHVFLFAIKWPLFNFPPTLSVGRSVVETQYVLKAFVRLVSEEEFMSEGLPVEFRPHIDPSVAKMEGHDGDKHDVIVKDDNGRVLGEASLSCANKGTLFGQDCQLSLVLLIRQSDAKQLPRKAKVEVSEIHRLTDGSKEQVFALSHETVTFPPNRIKGHKECTIPLRVRIPVPEIDTRRGATGLPTLRIGNLEVAYSVRVTIPLIYHRFMTSKTKAIVVDCPVVVGNVKTKEKSSTRKVPRLIVNSEGEGLWDTQSTSSSKRETAGRRNIMEWHETCDIPRVLPCGDVEEDDIV